MFPGSLYFAHNTYQIQSCQQHPVTAGTRTQYLLILQQRVVKKFRES